MPDRTATPSSEIPLADGTRIAVEFEGSERIHVGAPVDEAGDLVMDGDFLQTSFDLSPEGVIQDDGIRFPSSPGGDAPLEQRAVQAVRLWLSTVEGVTARMQARIDDLSARDTALMGRIGVVNRELAAMYAENERLVDEGHALEERIALMRAGLVPPVFSGTP